MPSASHTPQTPLDVLKAARELISVPERWAQGSYQIGRCFCAVGAIYAACGPNFVLMADRYGAESALRDTLQTLGRPRDIEGFNDTSSHPEVLDLFDRTIARLEAEAAHD